MRSGFLFWQIYPTLTPRIATQNSPNSFGDTNNYSSFFYYLVSILATSGIVATITVRMQELEPAMIWRKSFLVETDEPEQRKPKIKQYFFKHNSKRKIQK